MSWQLHSLDLAEPFLPSVADWILARARRAGEGDLSDVMVLMPSSRACASLRHVLLERSGRDALLLPRLLTPPQLIEMLAARLDQMKQDVPPDDLRATLLAHLLRDEPWLTAHPESVSGVARELCALFDELRLAGRLDLLAGDGARAEEMDIEPADDRPEEEFERRDLRRIRRAWHLYRLAVPVDATDRTLAVHRAVMASGDWPGPPCRILTAAGFVHLDRIIADLLGTAGRYAKSTLLQPAAADAWSRLLLISFARADAETHPLSPGRQVATVLTEPDSQNSAPPLHATDSPIAADNGAEMADQPYHNRLAELVAGGDLAAATRNRLFLKCGDPEEESLVVVAEVVSALKLAGPDANAGALPRIGVATTDRALAARIAAQLRDAGIDVEDTGGVPLSSTPAGVLAREILRTTITGLRYEPLLETLTHPYVRILPKRADHMLWTLRLEKMVRGRQAPRAGLAALRRQAEERDQAVTASWHLEDPQMSRFVERTLEAFAPLLALRRREHVRWRELLSAWRQCWERLAPEQPLPTAERGRDTESLMRLMEDLESVAGQLSPVSLTEFTAEFSRLLNERTHRPLRGVYRPVLVTGLLEARLEHFDLLILAGMSEEIFPGRLRRPLFLSDRFRRAHRLRHWRRQVAEQAELFLRLMHNGRRLVVTWPAERLGQPSLPSPLVSRLQMGWPELVGDSRQVPVYRRPDDMPPRERIITRQEVFAAESHAIRGSENFRVQKYLSHSGLSLYRDCPYRFLLEKGYDLRKAEEVLEEFQAKDQGVLVHECLRRFLAPGGPGQQALRAADAARARKHLQEIAARVFGEGAAELPQRLLWQEAFLASADDIVAFEVERQRTWRPVVLEGEFALTLGRLRDWIADAAAHDAGAKLLGDQDGEPGDLNAATRDFPLRGKIDRIDVRTDGHAMAARDAMAAGDAMVTVDAMAARNTMAAVIDYKTGAIPPPSWVADGRELQVILYAIAVECGAVPALAPAPSPWRVVQGAYYEIQPAKAPFDLEKPHLPADTAQGRQMLLAGASLILQTALQARRRDLPFALIPAHWDEVGAGPLPCGHCPFAGICRLEERHPPGRVLSRLRPSTGQWR